MQSARGDDLSDAQAQQKKLEKLIADQKKQMADLSSMQAALQAQMGATRNKLNSVAQSLSATQSDITKLQAQITVVKNKYDATVAQLGDLEQQLAVIEDEEAQKAQDLEYRRGVLAQRLVAAYQEDQTSLLEQLLQAHSITDALSDVSYYMDMSAADKALADQIQRDQRTLAEVHATVVETRDATESLRQATADQKKQLDGEMAQLNAAQARLVALKKQVQAQLAAEAANQAKLAANKAALDKSIADAKAQQAALAKKIDQLLAAQSRRGGVPSKYSGTFLWPMSGTITQPFGCTGFWAEPPYGSCAHFHQGIDVANACGTPIHAAGPGSILYVGYDGGGAWIIVIAHASNLATLYGHMIVRSVPGVRAGAWVTKGQVIGYEGRSGNATGCHLHWGVRLNGTYVNPLLFI